MFLQHSLRAQILALLGGSLLLILLIALACFNFLSGGIQTYRGLLDGPLEASRLAVAANTLRDFLADTFNRLKRSTAELDSASGELNAIASLMAQGTREQFSRTDQVATAMHEITAIATTNQENVQRTQAASQSLHGLSGQLGEVTRRLHA